MLYIVEQFVKGVEHAQLKVSDLLAKSKIAQFQAYVQIVNLTMRKNIHWMR